MPTWLDLAIVTAALLASALGTWHLLRRGRAAACARECGACAPKQTKSELVHIGAGRDRTSRGLLAHSRTNR
jgi:hypothetical protein